MDILTLTNGWHYVLILLAVMIFSGLVRQYNLFGIFYQWIISKVKNKKILLGLLTAVGGILPVPGRISVSAGFMDTIIEPEHRQNYGILNYLATHHYYLWSPLEKSVIIPMAVLNISYWYFISIIWPLLIISLGYTVWFLWKHIPEDTIMVQDWNAPEHTTPWWKYIKPWTLLGLSVVIIMGNLVRYYVDFSSMLLLASNNKLFWTATFGGFAASFLMGSSAKFAGITSLLSVAFGIQYLIWFFAWEFVGYLISPFHKCVYIGKAYFNTPWGLYFKHILTWGVIMLVAAGIVLIC